MATLGATPSTTTFPTSSAPTTGRTAGASAAVASVVALTVPAADTSYQVWANVNVVSSTLHDFDVECAYTDEKNVARVLKLSFVLVAGSTLVVAVGTANGLVPHHGIPLSIRCKASTTITIRTEAAGTYNTVSYNIEGFILATT